MAADTPLDQFGRIDIYVFDQLLKGNITERMRVLDAGCGSGRNVEYLLRRGAEVHGVDRSPEAIHRVRTLAEKTAVEPTADRFHVGTLTQLDYPDAHFDVVICSAVLHFADDEDHFEAIIRELWRVLCPGGLLFTRLASTIGVEAKVTPLQGRWHSLPDGSDRFLVDEPYLMRISHQLNATLVDPLKTTVVQEMRSMTTWVLRKGPAKGHDP